MGERRGLKALEIWCRRITQGYPGVCVENMTTSWRDGLAFCAMIHHFRPDLIDFSKLNKDDILHNNELAFRIAHQHLGIPALLDAEDMVNYQVPDRLSILTYLSQYYQALAQSPVNSPSRLAPKRQAPLPERNIVLPTSTSPPSKVLGMARSTSGVSALKANCVECKLPVFAAERMSVNKQLYHTGCFRCTQCDHPMADGNYKMADGDGYHCITCPNASNDAQVVPRSTLNEPVTASIVRSVLEKSLSDEDKASGLLLEDSVLFDVSHSNGRSSERNMARSHFMQDLIESPVVDKMDQKQDNLNASVVGVNISDYSNSDGLSDIVLGVKDVKDFITKDDLDKSNSVHLAVSDCVSSDAEEDVVIKEETKGSDFEVNDERKVDGVSGDVSNGKTLKKIMPRMSDYKIHTGSTGDTPENFKTLLGKRISVPPTYETQPQKGTSIRLNPYSSDEDDGTALEDSIFDEDGTKFCSTPNDAFIKARSKFMQNSDTSLKTVFESKDKQNQNQSLTSDLVNTSDIVANNVDVESEVKEVVEGGSVEIIEISDDSVIVISDESTKEQEETQQEELDQETTNPFEENEISVGSRCEDKPKHEEIKEEASGTSLNPFSDDEDVEECPKSPLKKLKCRVSDLKLENTPDNSKTLKSQPRVSLNPFSSDEDEDESKDKECGKNPFSSDEDDDDTSTKNDIGKIPLKKVIPLPRKGFIPDYNKKQSPRVSLNPFSSDEDDDDESPLTTHGSMSSVQPRSSFGSMNSLTSTASSSINSTYRKKKQAPKPPIPSFRPSNSTGSSPHASITSSPSTSAQHSPKPRKSRRAPLPPPLQQPRLADTLIVPIPATRRLFNYASTNDANITPSDALSSLDYEKEKVVKDEANRQTQSSGYYESPSNYDTLTTKWKRKKGQAPGLPLVAQKRTIKALPMTELNKELNVIEVQLQGLNKQGDRLETIIRDQCEGPDTDPNATEIPIETEDLILQLFEVVNEKNELFRRQTQLMHIKRQHRLEAEQAEIEYEVRCIMHTPSKSDSQKLRETELINRLVEIVNTRAEIVECLEMERVRCVEEDDSIAYSMNSYASNRDKSAASESQASSTEASPKKEKKKKFSKLLKFASKSKSKNKQHTSNK